MGVAEARLEPWGTFGRSWSYTRVAVEMIEPSTTTLDRRAAGLERGDRGPVEAQRRLRSALARSRRPRSGRPGAPRRAHRGLPDRARRQAPRQDRPAVGAATFTLPSEPETQRWSDGRSRGDEDGARADAPTISGSGRGCGRRSMADECDLATSSRSPRRSRIDYSQRRMRLMDRLIEFLDAEGVAAVLMTDDRGSGGVDLRRGASARTRARRRFRRPASSSCPSTTTGWCVWSSAGFRSPSASRWRRPFPSAKRRAPT